MVSATASYARVQAHRHVAAADVEADAGDADLALVGDDAADRLGVAQVTVGADHAGHGIADRHAVAHLGDRRGIVIADHGERTVPILRRLRPKVDDRRRGLLRLARVQLRARRVAEGAPRGHAAFAARLRHAAVGIDACRDGKLAGAGLGRIGTAGHGCLLRPGFNTAGAASPCRRMPCFGEGMSPGLRRMGQRGVAASVLPGNSRRDEAYTGSNLKPSPQRFIRPEDGDGKCAVHTNVDVSHRQPNSLRRDSPACGEL